MPTEIAAGGLLFRGSEIAVVHRKRYDDWSLPKGKVKSGEHPVVAARREIAEETGVVGALTYRLPKQEYDASGRPKVVHYWAVRAGQGDFVPSREVDELDWLDADTAAARLTYQGDRALLAAFLDRPPPTSTVLLVRHAHAGSRRDWDGPDEARPLSRKGRRQAGRLATGLTAWEPAYLAAADRVRCAQTVEPLATTLSLPLAVEPAISEESTAADFATALERILAAAQEHRAAVLCSQGGAIPALVSHLVRRHRIETVPVLSSKGSCWALTFAGDDLIAADYYADFDRTQ